MWNPLRPRAAPVRSWTFIERAIVAFFGSIVLLVAFLIYLAYVKTLHYQDYEAAVIRLDNGDAVCDNFELWTAMSVDETPCGQLLLFLIKLNQEI